MARGFANLPTLVALTMIIIVISVGITAVSVNEIFDTTRISQSRKAYTDAEIGARDALLRIARNKNYTCESGVGCPYALELVPNGCGTGYAGCAIVTASAGVGTIANPKIIISTGRVNNSIRKVQVTIIYDGSQNGEITTAIWTEITS